MSLEHRESDQFANPSNKAVVLVVDKYSQDVHLANLTAGVKYPVKYDRRGVIQYISGFFSILADLANVQPGVRVFFYRRRIDEPPEGQGFIGEWEATDAPYEDLQTELTYNNLKILGCCPDCKCPVSTLAEGKLSCENCERSLDGHILPLRFPIKPVRQYSRYLDDNTAYVDITDEGRLSTLIFRKVYGKGRERSVNPILPEEAEKLRRLLERVEREGKNQSFLSPTPSSPHVSSHKRVNHYLDFSWIAQLATAQVQSFVQRPFRITPITIGHQVRKGVQLFSEFQLSIPYTPPLEVVVESPKVFTYSVQSANNTLRLTRWHGSVSRSG